MKKSIFALLAFVALSTTAYAQDDQGTRSLSVYLCGNTGVLNQATGHADGDTPRTFDGNWTEFGLVYEQDFNNGLGLEVSIIGGGSVTGVWEDVSDDGDGSDHRVKNAGYEMGDVYAVAGFNYGIAGFDMYLSLDTTLLASFGLGYSFSIASGDSLSIGSDICFFMMPQAYVNGEAPTGYGSSPEDSLNKVETLSHKASGVVDLFQVYVGYSIPFAEKWGFSTKAMFRFSGTGEYGDFYTDSNAFLFGQTFYIRWDNTVSFQATDSLSLYGRVRYQAYNLAQKTMSDDYSSWEAADVDHNVSLQAGLSYSFDF